MTLPHFHIPDCNDSLGLPGQGKSDAYDDTNRIDQLPIDNNQNPYSASDEFELPLIPDILAHLCTLRIGIGERFVLVDSSGNATSYEACATPHRKSNTLAVRLCERWVYQRPAAVTLIQGISVAERMDLTIRQTTELGVSRIVPLESARSTVRLTPESRLLKQKRWQRLALAAADQAACAMVPEITAPLMLADAIKTVSDCDVLLVAWEEYDGPGIREALLSYEETNKPHVGIFIGPEGGFEASEVAVLQAAGAIPVSLGSSILRTETAAVVAVALILHELGELGNDDANTTRLG